MLQYLRSLQNVLASKCPNLGDTAKFGLLFAGAEVTQQVIIKKIWDDNFNLRSSTDPMDWGSVLRYSVWGFLIYPHVLRRWYSFLDTRFATETAGLRVAVIKTLTDQALFPVPILASFYVFLSLLEGKRDSWQQLTEECRTKLATTLKARYCFMLPAQFVNFALVPPQHRVIYVGCITFFWLNVLCVFKRLDINSDVFN